MQVVPGHRRKLGKNTGRTRVRASGVQARAQPMVMLGWTWKGVGLRSEPNSCLKWGMKIFGYEKVEFSQICKLNFRGSIGLEKF